MKITALAPWFGAKRTIANRIVAEIGNHRAYWEPFCGSMAVLLAKPQVSFETVNDLHGDLVNLARVVQDLSRCSLLYSRLKRFIPCEQLFRESLGLIRSCPVETCDICPVDRAYHYFVASWAGMNGVAGTLSTKTNFARRFSPTGGSPSTRIRSAAESIPDWHERLTGVMILRGDAFDLIEKIADEPGTVIYCDPPYLEKGAKYVHDFASADHDRLAEALARFRKTRVIVSYYDHDRLTALYPGWRKTTIEVSKSLVNAGQRTKGAVKAHEVLLMNFDGSETQSESIFEE